MWVATSLHPARRKLITANPTSWKAARRAPASALLVMINGCKWMQLTLIDYREIDWSIHRMTKMNRLKSEAEHVPHRRSITQPFVYRILRLATPLRWTARRRRKTLSTWPTTSSSKALCRSVCSIWPTPFVAILVIALCSTTKMVNGSTPAVAVKVR